MIIGAACWICINNAYRASTIITARAIRTTEGDSCHTPIAALTANAMDSDREHCMRCGMDDFVAKPFDAQEAAQIARDAAQVRDLLGSPMLADPFHADRWDYIFTIRRQGTEPQRRHVVVWFEGDALKSVDAPSDIPTERDFVASINSFKPKGDSPKLALSGQVRPCQSQVVVPSRMRIRSATLAP